MCSGARALNPGGPLYVLNTEKGAIAESGPENTVDAEVILHCMTSPLILGG